MQVANSRVEGISAEIMKQLQYYANNVRDKVEDAKNESATTFKKDVARDSPKKRPSYAKGWRIKRTSKRLIVHNKTDYQLTHLLEHGHALRNGDRFEGKPHIRPNEEKVVREFLKKIERAIEP
jgi:hypothetical protein